jgi:hypothetical protein
MVEIRTIKPMVRISMPKRPSGRVVRQARRFQVVVRRRRDFLPPTPQPTPCVLWQGTANKDGYGVRWIHVGDGWQLVMMHRWIVQVVRRRLDSTEIVMHKCDNRLCFRFDHLQVGSILDNNADMKAKGRNSLPPRNVFHGEDHPMSKLTVESVREIRLRVSLGEPRKALAERFGITVETVGKIVRRERWGFE